MVIELFNWQDHIKPPSVKPWRPRALSHEEWPPDYRGVYAFRMAMLAEYERNPKALIQAKAYYKTRPAEFIMHWMDTYNPRKVNNKWVPFVFFKRQEEFIIFIHECRNLSTNALVEKCRDVGLTWLACAYSVWSWLFIRDDAIGWGSRKQELVHRIGDPDSIFDKMQQLLRRLPQCWLPDGFSWRDHATFMKLINPENGSIIAGEAGDNMGRGGRKAVYMKDESAHYERPELIEAALGDNTNVQVDISSVNGVGNVFHRRRKDGVDWQPGQTVKPDYTQVFVFDWRHHPEKTQAWYDARKARAEREGLQHLFAQEVDRNYSAALSNTIINRQWIDACIDAHKRVPCLIEYIKAHGVDNTWSAGLDVADGGVDRNALSLSQWIIVRKVQEWGERDAGVTTRRAVATCREYPRIKVQYDSIGVGAGVKAEYNRLVERFHEGNRDDDCIDPLKMEFVAWNAGAGVQWPAYRVIPDDDETPTNKEYFGNLKAQAWWSTRTRCYKTFQALEHGVIYKPDELISFDGDMGSILHQLCDELGQACIAPPTSTLKMIVDKQPDGMKSPNLADAVVMDRFPIDSGGQLIIGSR